MDKLYTVASTKPIYGMGKIQGPLTTPSKIDFADVLEMVRKGYDIYQVNPVDHSEKVKVTISNINNITFKNTRSTTTLQRKLNREIQELNKPMIVDVVSKDTKSVEFVETKVDNKQQKDSNKNKQNENKKDNVEKISTPDTFTK